MNVRFRLAAAAVATAMMCALVAACSHASNGTGSVGQAGGAPTDAGFGSPAPAPTPSAGATQGNSHGGGNPGGGTSSSSSPASGGKGSIPVFTFAGSNYSVAGTGSCHWILDGADHLQLWVDFTISYSGFLGPSPVAWSAGNDKDSYSASNTASTFPTTITVKLGGTILFEQSKWPGTTVTVTMTLTPQGSDGNAGDNTASVRVTVPDFAPGVDLLEPLTCS